MKKYIFLLILFFITFSINAQNRSDYDNILNGNLSAFVGYWVNGNNIRIYLQPDGRAFRDDKASGFKKNRDFYSWGDSSEWGGVTVMLFPVGVVIYRFDSKGEYDPTGKSGIVESNTKEVRLFLGHEYPYDPKDIFYKESEFPATHIASENLRLRTDQNLSSDTIKILEKGIKVVVYEWGNSVSIDGKNARWAYVFTIDGLQGWCYSGYLTELK